MTDVVEVIQADRDASPFFQPPQRPVISVEWPTGGWIVWNWVTASWDSASDDERASIKREEALALARLAAQTPPDSGAVGELVERCLPEARAIADGLCAERQDFDPKDADDAEAWMYARNGAWLALSRNTDALTSLLAERDRWKLQSDDWQKRGWELGNECDELRARVEQLSSLGSALVDACDAMIEDTNPIFAEMHLARGRSYTGRQIGEELEALRTALSPTTGEGNGPTGGEPG